MNRNEIQAFIDGHLKAGGDPDKLKENLLDWMDKHPVYPQSKAVRDVIESDLESYRGTKKAVVQPITEEIVP